MSGLYQRALHILNNDQESSPEMSDTITFDSESGIPIENQKEILTQIENLVSKKRISETDEVLNIKPQKRGILFPILINSIAAIITVGVFFVFQWYFSQQVQQIQLDAKIYSGGDSKLISNIKKEAEARLNEKEAEINNIQEQLKNLDTEKEKLQENMNAEITRKQMELEEVMRLELENERERLKEQGISTEDIDAQIETIKEQKELENKQELESFQRQAEEQRLEQEKRIEELKNEYSTNLEDLNSEKASLENDLEEAERRVKEFEEKQKALEKEKTEAELL